MGLLLLSDTSASCPWLISRRARRCRYAIVFIRMLLKTLAIHHTQCPFYENLSEQCFLHFDARKIYTIILEMIDLYTKAQRLVKIDSICGKSANILHR